MEYIKIPLYGKYGKGKYTLVDGDYDGEYFSLYRWRLSPQGYPTRVEFNGESEGGKRKTIFLHHLVCSVKEGQWRDHINGDTLDNRSCNLRPVTPKQNCANKKHRKNSKSPYKGVFRLVNGRVNNNGTIWQDSKWSIRIAGKRIKGIKFDTAEEAARAYDKIAKEKYGQYARLNFTK